jgi:hypothetical protein
MFHTKQSVKPRYEKRKKKLKEQDREANEAMMLTEFQ